jgi:hypothetical protein
MRMVIVACCLAPFHINFTINMLAPPDEATNQLCHAIERGNYDGTC